MNENAPSPAAPGPAVDLREADVQVRMIPMRDGKRLYTVICFVPGERIPRGTVVFRSPYYHRDYLPLPSEPALKHGLTAVFQSCRGTGWSEGEFFPSDRELEERDGADLLEWIVKQPWSNGKIVLAGSSYSGWTQWAAAYSGNPAVVGMTPHVAPLYSCCVTGRTGGGNSLGFMVSWGLSMYHRNKFGYGNVPKFDVFLNHLPVNEIDVFAGCGYVEFFRAFSETAKEPWKLLDGIPEKFARITAPAFVSGGWFDGFKEETFLSFKYMKTLAGSAKARNFTRLLVGPWIHGGLVNADVFGAENDQSRLREMSERFRVNLLRDPETDPCPDLPAVQFFLMGENRWCSAEDWPPPHREKVFYFRESGALAEDGSRAEESFSSYTYDPADPTPSFNGSRNALGCYDRSDTEQRADVLSFTSAKLKKPLRIAGNVRVRLFASSSAPDTDFYATLTDVCPDGRSLFLTSGMVRARFCKKFGEERFLEPGELREYEIDLSETANTFLPGHAVRVEIHSADFPKDARNPNTTAPVNEGVLLRKAAQKIFHDKLHPSRLILPESTGAI